MAHALYECWALKGLGNKSYIHIDGPHDRFGYIVNKIPGKPPLQTDEDKIECYLVRGTGDQKPCDQPAFPYVAYSEPAACGARMKSSTKFLAA
jgi:hypothetical protein